MCRGGVGSAERKGGPPPVQFTKHVLDSELPGISITVTDVDGDGILDIVAAGGPSGGPSPWSKLVYWYRVPDWPRKPVCTLDDKAIILHLEAGAFAGRASGKEAALTSGEVVVTDGQLGQVWWCRYDRKKKEWIRKLIVEDVQNAHGAANGDIDGDGWADLLLPTQRGTPKRGVIWARNPGSSNQWWEKHPLAESFQIGGWQHYVRLKDLNGDGKLDALHGSHSRDGWFGFWLQGADPVKSWEFHELTGPMREGTNLDAADLNGDGKVDLVGTEGHGVGVWWFPAPEYKAIRVDDTLKSTHSLALADFNGDGTTDIATCGYESRKVVCFVNNGKGEFNPNLIDDNQCAYDACAADLDADGDLDLLVAGQNSTNVVWYENLRIGKQGSKAAREEN